MRVIALTLGAVLLCSGATVAQDPPTEKKPAPSTLKGKVVESPLERYQFTEAEYRAAIGQTRGFEFSYPFHSVEILTPMASFSIDANGAVVRGGNYFQNAEGVSRLELRRIRCHLDATPANRQMNRPFRGSMDILSVDENAQLSYSEHRPFPAVFSMSHDYDNPTYLRKGRLVTRRFCFRLFASVDGKLQPYEVVVHIWDRNASREALDWEAVEWPFQTRVIAQDGKKRTMRTLYSVPIPISGFNPADYGSDGGKEYLTLLSGLFESPTVTDYVGRTFCNGFFDVIAPSLAGAIAPLGQGARMARSVARKQLRSALKKAIAADTNPRPPLTLFMFPSGLSENRTELRYWDVYQAGPYISPLERLKAQRDAKKPTESK